MKSVSSNNIVLKSEGVMPFPFLSSETFIHCEVHGSGIPSLNNKLVKRACMIEFSWCAEVPL